MSRSYRHPAPECCAKNSAMRGTRSWRKVPWRRQVHTYSTRALRRGCVDWRSPRSMPGMPVFWELGTACEGALSAAFRSLSAAGFDGTIPRVLPAACALFRSPEANAKTLYVQLHSKGHPQ